MTTRLLDPCPDCGRPLTEITGYPEAHNPDCWWCEYRSASGGVVSEDNPGG